MLLKEPKRQAHIGPAEGGWVTAGLAHHVQGLACGYGLRRFCARPEQHSEVLRCTKAAERPVCPVWRRGMASCCLVASLASISYGVFSPDTAASACVWCEEGSIAHRRPARTAAVRSSCSARPSAVLHASHVPAGADLRCTPVTPDRPCRSVCSAGAGCDPPIPTHGSWGP